MTNRSTSQLPPALASGLDRLQDLTRVGMPAGQVLVYAGHYPQGLFIVLGGRVVLEGPPDGAMLRDVNGTPFVLPAPAEIDLPSAYSVRVDSDADLLFVPRSVALATPEVTRLLDAGLLAPCSLRPPRSAGRP